MSWLGLSQILTVLPGQQFGHGAARDAVLSGERFLHDPTSFPPRDGFKSYRVGQFGKRVSLSAVGSSLGNFVGNVFGIGAKEEMPPPRQQNTVDFVSSLLVVSDTSGNIARMQDIKPFGYGPPVSQFPSGSVSEDRSVLGTSRVELPVSLGPDGCSPQPARLKLVNIEPEPPVHRDVKEKGSANVCAVSGSATFHSRWVGTCTIELHRVPPVSVAKPAADSTQRAGICMPQFYHVEGGHHARATA